MQKKPTICYPASFWNARAQSIGIAQAGTDRILCRSRLYVLQRRHTVAACAAIGAMGQGRALHGLLCLDRSCRRGFSEAQPIPSRRLAVRVRRPDRGGAGASLRAPRSGFLGLGRGYDCHHQRAGTHAAGMVASARQVRSEKHRYVDLADRGVEVVQGCRARRVLRLTVILDVAKVRVIEANAADVERDRGALEELPAIGQERVSGFGAERIIVQGGEILVAGRKILRVGEGKQIAVKGRLPLLVVSRPPLEYPDILDRMGVVE